MTLITWKTVAIALPLATLVACTHPGGGPHGMGGGMGGMQGMAMGPDNTHGWGMMSAQEREEHHRRMMAARSPEECRAMHTEHQRRMTERSRERGITMNPPPHDPCDQMRQRGMWK